METQNKTKDLSNSDRQHADLVCEHFSAAKVVKLFIAKACKYSTSSRKTKERNCNTTNGGRTKPPTANELKHMFTR